MTTQAQRAYDAIKAAIEANCKSLAELDYRDVMDELDSEITSKALLAAWAGKCSPRAAIKLQCLDFCGEDVQSVADCGDRCCPLWKFRPFQKRRATK